MTIAFQALVDATNKLGKAINFLKQAYKAYDRTYLEANDNAFQIIGADKKG